MHKYEEMEIYVTNIELLIQVLELTVHTSLNITPFYNQKFAI
jgi:hypothetical protein